MALAHPKTTYGFAPSEITSEITKLQGKGTIDNAFARLANFVSTELADLTNTEADAQKKHFLTAIQNTLCSCPKNEKELAAVWEDLKFTYLVATSESYKLRDLLQGFDLTARTLFAPPTTISGQSSAKELHPRAIEV